MKKLFLPMLALLLTGCADIRGRVSPDALAVNSDPPALAMHISEEAGTVTAAAEPENFPDAMRAAAGAEVSTGHISVLLLHANPADILPDYLDAGWLAPTAQVVYCEKDAVSLLLNTPPSADEIKAAAETGLLPPRTADAVLADLLGGSGVTALTAYTAEGYRLAVWDTEECCGLLSADACRGLALLCGKYRSFTYSDAELCFAVEHASPVIRAKLSGGVLHISVTGTFRCSVRKGEQSAVQPALTRLLTAALTETVTQHGADLLALQERAGAGGISPADWREILRTATVGIDVSPMD
ncbi:MAG: hypothetical protein IK107_05475 [Oscillospiraceae bacterium]|nr:hypothetical protein [Oscillospiraceae bacterium]